MKMTAKSVAKKLGVSVGTLADWRHRGTGPAYTKREGRNGCVFYSIDEILAFVDTEQFVKAKIHQHRNWGNKSTILEIKKSLCELREMGDFEEDDIPELEGVCSECGVKTPDYDIDTYRGKPHCRACMIGEEEPTMIWQNFSAISQI